MLELFYWNKKTFEERERANPNQLTIARPMFSVNSHARRPCIGGEGVIVREPTIDSDGRRSIEPGEENQFLQMVCVTIGHGNRREVGSGEWISDLEIILAARLLSDVSPRWHWVIPEGVIHPLPHLVGGDGRIKNSRSENTGCVEIHRRVGLDG